MVPTRKKRILIVEDQPMVADALKVALAMDGYEVYTAQNGRDALALFHRGKFALIFTDFEMPEMGGYEFASIVKGQDAHQPIILITAYSYLAELNPSSHVDLVLEKPWSLDELRTAISKVLPT